MKQHLVWSEGDEEADAVKVQAWGPCHAAEEVVERLHAELDYPEDQEVFVKDPDGKVTKWTVHVEHKPVFYAYELPISHSSNSK